MEIWEFIKLLLGKWIVRILLLLAIGSALSKYFPGYGVPTWVPHGTFDMALIVAAWDVFRKKQEEIDLLRAREAHKPELVIYPQDGSRFYVRTDFGRSVGTYLHLDLIIVNKGTIVSVIDRYELEVKEMRQSYSDLRPRPIIEIQGKNTRWSLGQLHWLMEGNIIRVGGGGSTGRGILPLEILGIPPEGTGTIHCRLTVFDDAGDEASCDLEVPGSW